MNKIKANELKIISAKSELSRDMLGLYVASGEGESFRIYGWAADLKRAKKLKTDVRKNYCFYK